MLTTIFLLVAGFFFLIYGAEYLVKGSASLARRLGVRAFIVGLTVVAFGTSAPELVVNLFSAGSGVPDLAVGNILGSNIANILLILGVSALIAPIVIEKGTTWREIPFSLLGALVLLVVGSDYLIDRVGPNMLSHADGLVLLLFFAIFVYYTFIATRTTGERGESVDVYSSWKSIGFIAIGIAGLVLGGKFIVDSAVVIASAIGFSEHVIGVTVVALGTSLPELATAIVASMKKQVDLVVGNVVGSNIFNLFFVLGLTATVSPLPFSEAAFFDTLMVVGASLLLFIGMFVAGKQRLSRTEGVVYVLLYVGYVGWKIFV